MVNDLNKEMHVTYNHLNLPVLVDFGNNNKIEYLYSATGARIKTTVYTNGTISKEMHYASNIVYDGSELDHILISEGRVRKEENSFKYEYFLKDHLGNVRVVFGDIWVMYVLFLVMTVVEMLNYYKKTIITRMV